MKRKITEFKVAIYNNDGKIEVAFDKAKKVPKAYANFVATLEIACINDIHRVIRIADGQTDKSAD